MKTVIIKMLAVASALLLFDCAALESTNRVSETDLSCFFESIERKGTNLVLVARWSFLYSIDGKDDRDDKFSKAGEKIILPEGSKLVVVERHHSMVFSPMNEDNGRKGFRISHRKSHRRGVATTDLAYLLPADETSDSSGGEKGSAAQEGKRAMAKSSGAPEKGAEKKCLKGLTLLPCEEDSK